MLKSQCHCCRRYETRVRHPWTVGHTFRNPKLKSTEDQCVGVHESGKGPEKARLGRSVGCTGADIGVFDNPVRLIRCRAGIVCVQLD